MINKKISNPKLLFLSDQYYKKSKKDIRPYIIIGVYMIILCGILYIIMQKGL